MNVIVLSHLRWDFVYQRPQHLLSRCAQSNPVWFIEEPVFDAQQQREASARLEISRRPGGVTVCVPHLPAGISERDSRRLQGELLKGLIDEHCMIDYVLWYYTPMAWEFTRDLSPKAVVYDCMDELSAFRGAPPGLRAAEAELLQRADVVFTGGRTLYEAKKHQHPNIHPFPSSIDRAHFAQARIIAAEPTDQANIPHPRLGFAGVIDERMDTALLGRVAALRPNWHFVMIGPVVKISDADLPQAANIHYLGGRDYQCLPAYMSGWDIGILPFALNESTRYISPTKTPEYLAAGLPVISTAITDVVHPYGDSGLVKIAGNAQDLIGAAESMLAPQYDAKNDTERLRLVDEFLSRSSWDSTWQRMWALIQEVTDAQRSELSRCETAQSA